MSEKYRFTTCLATVLVILSLASTADAGEAIALEQRTGSSITWIPQVDFKAVVLTVSGPGDYLYTAEFSAATTPRFEGVTPDATTWVSNLIGLFADLRFENGAAKEMFIEGTPLAIEDAAWSDIKKLFQN